MYKLLGKKDLGTTEFPPMETALVDGEVAFRQHAGGHTTGPNWPTFLKFAGRYIKRPTVDRAGVVPMKAAAQLTRESSLDRDDHAPVRRQGGAPIVFDGENDVGCSGDARRDSYACRRFVLQRHARRWLGKTAFGRRWDAAFAGRAAKRRGKPTGHHRPIGNAVPASR